MGSNREFENQRAEVGTSAIPAAHRNTCDWVRISNSTGTTFCNRGDHGLPCGIRRCFFAWTASDATRLSMSKKQRRAIGGSFLGGLLGGIVGIGLGAFVLPFLAGVERKHQD